VLSLGLQRRVELQRSTGSSGLGTDVSCRCTAGADVLALSLLRDGDSRRARRYGVFGWRCSDRSRAQRCYRNLRLVNGRKAEDFDMGCSDQWIDCPKRLPDVSCFAEDFGKGR